MDINQLEFSNYMDNYGLTYTLKFDTVEGRELFKEYLRSQMDKELLLRDYLRKAGPDGI